MLEPQWIIPLENRPVVLQMGIGVHGNVAIERYQLPFWCIHFYQYSGELCINGVTFPICPGTVSVIPAQVPLEYRFRGRSVHTYSHFTCAASSGGDALVTSLQDLGNRFDELNLAMEQAVGFWAVNPLRASVRLWDILWQLAIPQNPPGSLPLNAHPALEMALNLIELRLSEPLRVADLAREVGLSHNHLTRLFHGTVGKTVHGYIQERRVQRARHLLVSSTQPIKSIALEVGIADLHLFNKTIRRALGAPPRVIREQSQRRA